MFSDFFFVPVIHSWTFQIQGIGFFRKGNSCVATKIDSNTRSERFFTKQRVAYIACIGAAYFLAHQIAFLFPDTEKVLMAMWPAGGIGLAALLLSPVRLWPAIIAVIFIAGNTANLMAGRPMVGSLGFMTANILESLGCAWLILRTCGKNISFNRVSEVLALLSAAVMVNAVTALIGAGTAHVVSTAPFWNFWHTWWVADGLGILLVTPLIVSWLTRQKSMMALRWYRIVEIFLFFVLWSALAWLTFNRSAFLGQNTLPPYLIVALLAWPALRFGPRVTTISLLLLTIIVTTSSLVSDGPLIWGGENAMHRLLLAQLFTGVVAVAGLLLAASYSETKSAEKQSREEHTRLCTLGDNLPNGMVYQVVRELDGQMHFLYVSAGVERLNGVTAEEVLRDPSLLYRFIVEEDRSILATAESESARNLSVFNVVVRFRRPDGQIRWMQISSSPRLLEDGQMLWDGIQTDITERKRAEEAFQESESRAKAMLQAIPDLMFRMDSQGVFIDYKADINDLYAQSNPTIIGKRNRDITPPEFADLIDRKIRATLGTGVPQTFEYQLPVAGRGLRNYEARMVASGMDEVTAIVRDVTDRRRTEDTLSIQHDLSLALGSNDDIQLALEQILDAALRTENIDSGGIYRANQIGDLDLVTHRGLSPQFVEQASHYPADSPQTCLAREGRAHYGNYQDILREIDKEQEIEELRGLAIIPVLHQRQLLAVLNLASHTHDDIPQSTRLALETLAQQIGSILMRLDIADALRESRQNLQTLFDTVNDFLFVLDGTGHIMLTNVFTQNRLGYTPEELAGQDVLMVHPPERRAEVSAIVADMLAGKRDFCPIPLQAKDGTLIPVETRVTAGVWGGKPALFGLSRDITERKLAEAAQREGEANIRAVFNASDESIFLLAADGTLLALNDVAAQRMGYSREELIGRNVFDLISPDAAKRRKSFLEHALSTGQHVRFEDERYGRWMVNHLYPILNAEGKAVRLAIYSRDITELRQSAEDQEKLEAQNRQLQKSESLGRMAGAIAHHFNNQLQVVTMNLAMALDQLPHDAGDTVEMLADALQAARRGSEVSTLMLTYLGQTKTKRKPLNLSEICRRSLPMFQGVMPINAALESDLPAFGPVVSADENQIQQVLTNLITNAAEAANNKPCIIHLAVRTALPAEISSSCRFPVGFHPKHAAYACLEVTDTGCGIAAADIERLFDPFFSKKFTGRGLGLPVVLGIVRAHEGAITVESETGNWSIFRVYLPIAIEQIPQSPEKPLLSMEIQEGVTVLVVDDEELIRKSVEHLLTHLGLKVLTAKDGAHAVTVFQQHQDEIACVLCDLTMPHMDGWKTLAALRKITPGIPVILASGHNEETVLAGGHSELPQAYLQKPYRKDQLCEAICRAMGTSKA